MVPVYRAELQATIHAALRDDFAMYVTFVIRGPSPAFPGNQLGDL
jgi:hypothetical protein